MTRAVNVVKGRQGFQNRMRHEPIKRTLDTQAFGVADLDISQQERLDVFNSLTKNRATLSCNKLEFLNVHHTTPERLKQGSFNYSGEQTVLTSSDPVFTRQGHIKTARVLEYVEMLINEDDLADIQVTDIPPGGGHWHLNGLHRLVASRILGRSVEVEIWR